MMGDSVEKCVRALEEQNIDVIGSNCTLGSSDMIELMEEMKKTTDKPISAKPNAGKPKILGDGKTIYEQPVEDFVNDIGKMIDLGVKIVGGCCGTTPETIKGIKSLINSL